MKNRRVSALLSASALSVAATAFVPLASAQQTRSWDPIKATGLEGGGWTHPFRMPQQNVPTHWDMTNFPRTPHPSQTVGMPPVGGPIHGTVPSGIGGHPGFQPGMGGGHPGFQPGMGGGHPGFQPGMGGGHPGFQPGMGGGQLAGLPVGNPFISGSVDINLPITVTDTSATDSQTVVAPVAVTGGPGAGSVEITPPPNSGLAPPTLDDMAPAAPDVGVPDGMFGVVVVNQTGRTLKVLTKFFDPPSGRWIARWNEAISPGQAVRLGATTVGTFFMRADMTDDNGAVVPVLEGNDAVFQSPRGLMGLRRANVTQQGADLVATINE